MTVTPGLSNVEFISDINGNLIDISTIRQSNSNQIDYDDKFVSFIDTITTADSEETLMD